MVFHPEVFVSKPGLPTRLPSTDTPAVVVDESPAVSVTVTVAVDVPVAVYVCVAVAPACGPVDVPSPHTNVYDAIGVASTSVEPDASAVTDSGTAPIPGFTVRAATGGSSVKTPQPWVLRTWISCSTSGWSERFSPSHVHANVTAPVQPAVHHCRMIACSSEPV